MIPLLATVVMVASLATRPCDIALECPGGSTAGVSFAFTVSSTATPVTVKIAISGTEIQTTDTSECQQRITVAIPDDARGKTLEIVAENKDGHLVSWTETVQ